jgi:ribosomal protein L31E
MTSKAGKEVRKLCMTKGRLDVKINEVTWSRGTQRMPKRSFV